MHCRLNCFDIKSLSLRSPGPLSSTNVLFGFKWEQKHIFGSYFSFKSFLVKPDTYTHKENTVNPECTETTKTKHKSNSPKIYKLCADWVWWLFFFPLIVNTDVAENYKYFSLISWWTLPAVSTLVFGPEGKTRINTFDSFVFSVLRDFDKFRQTQPWEENQPVSPGRSQAQNQTWSPHSNRHA